MSSSDEIWIVPFFGQGHLLPSIELCKQIASRNFKTTLLIPSDLYSTIPSSLHQHPLVEVVLLPSSPHPPPPPPSPPLHGGHHQEASPTPTIGQALENYLLSSRARQPPACAVVDVMMGRMGPQLFNKHGIPTIAFFTSGACSAAMEYAMWKLHLRTPEEDVKPGEIRLVPGLPHGMAITDSDFKTRPPNHPPPPPAHHQNTGPHNMMGPPPPPPPRPGSRPPWLEEFGGSIAYMMNTCDDLERPFIQYLADQIGKPVWGVGPLLPQEYYWKDGSSLIQDHQVRANRGSNVTEDQVIAWLDSKPRGSVLYVSFGTEVGPEEEEYANLADALEASSDLPFIWVVQSHSGRRPGPPPSSPHDDIDDDDDEGYFPKGLDEKVGGERGLIIHGWAPQLLILSHPSLGGFLSHCGWNSAVEAIGRGVPFLAWPIRGDQFHNAKLIVKHLRLGCIISQDLSRPVTKHDIITGIERLMGDEDLRTRAALLGNTFGQGFPATSANSLDAFADFIRQA
ncbi:hypothetical protein Tsubulata_006628 [Turnera subulata]|uniref:Glycosyltransferase n=1 Tax=Turnera subulata TaxID=218843 RepID=A0A9Q0FDE2_9ROSI|nr:hypothetical protein Tsubulata_006628 [Turnera subulata]